MLLKKKSLKLTSQTAALAWISILRHFFSAHKLHRPPINIQGGIFGWSALKMIKCQALRKFWYLDLFWRDLHGIWHCHFLGGTSKKTSCRSACYTCKLYCLYLSILRAFNSPAGELRCTSGSLVSQMSRGRAQKGQGGLARVSEETLPKAQQTQGTDYFDSFFDSFTSFSSK